MNQDRFTLTDNKTGQSVNLSLTDCQRMLDLLYKDMRINARVEQTAAATTEVDESSNKQKATQGEPARPFSFTRGISRY